eukprot:m.469900 g.469900  ORF g.469900 m.469900 type:complete len:290 (-) comp29217_c0_seq1:435-1304(-)
MARAILLLRTNGTPWFARSTRSRGSQSRCGKAGYVDGPGDTAAFQRPHGLTLTPDGDIIIADRGGKIRRVAIEDNTVTTVAGGQHGYRDGPATDARFSRPEDVAVDGAGVIWVADTFNHVIRRIDPDGMVSTVAGVPEKNGFRDGDATQALFSWPSGIAIEGDGCLLVADKGNQRIRRVEGLGVVPRDDMPRDVDDCEYSDLALATVDENTCARSAARTRRKAASTRISACLAGNVSMGSALERVGFTRIAGTSARPAEEKSVSIMALTGVQGSCWSFSTRGVVTYPPF